MSCLLYLLTVIGHYDVQEMSVSVLHLIEVVTCILPVKYLTLTVSKDFRGNTV